jgi:hypothetical protein
MVTWRNLTFYAVRFSCRYLGKKVELTGRMLAGYIECVVSLYTLASEKETKYVIFCFYFTL